MIWLNDRCHFEDTFFSFQSPPTASAADDAGYDDDEGADGYAEDEAMAYM